MQTTDDMKLLDLPSYTEVDQRHLVSLHHTRSSVIRGCSCKEADILSARPNI